MFKSYLDWGNIYQNGSYGILKRDQDFLVININSAKHFRTDKHGADTCERLFKHYELDDAPFNCSQKEVNFVSGIMSETFFSREQRTRGFYDVVCILLTHDCNLKCKYCFDENNRKKLILDDIDKNVFLKTFDELKTVNPSARFFLTGGEPLLSSDFQWFVEVIKSRNLFCGIITNGTLVNHNVVSQLKSMGIDEVRVSIDSFNSEINSDVRGGDHSTIVNNIIELANAGLDVVLSVTISSKNIQEIPSIVNFAKNHKVGINFSPLLPTGGGNRYNELLPDYKRFIQTIINSDESIKAGYLKGMGEFGIFRNDCGIGKNTLTIDRQGRIYPCNMMVSEENIIENISKISIAELMKNRQKDDRYFVENMKKCSDCVLRHHCGGSCRAASQQREGSYLVPSIDCELKMAAILENMFSYGKRIVIDEI